MPCVIRRINKTHHFPLDLCVIIIIHVSVAFGADLAAIFFPFSTSNRGQIGSQKKRVPDPRIQLCNWRLADFFKKIF